MLKCTLRSPKTINGGSGEKKYFFRRKNGPKKHFFSEFFSPNIISFETKVDAGSKLKAMVASGMSFQWSYVLRKSSNSTICQNYGKTMVFDPS